MSDACSLLRPAALSTHVRRLLWHPRISPEDNHHHTSTVLAGSVQDCTPISPVARTHTLHGHGGQEASTSSHSHGTHGEYFSSSTCTVTTVDACNRRPPSTGMARRHAGPGAMGSIWRQHPSADHARAALAVPTAGRGRGRWCAATCVRRGTRARGGVCAAGLCAAMHACGYGQAAPHAREIVSGWKWSIS